MRPMPLILAFLGLLAAFTPAQAESKPPAQGQPPATPKKAIPKQIQDGYALIHAGQIEQALEHFRAVLEKEPDQPLAQKALRPLNQATQLRKLLADEKHPRWVAAANWLFAFYDANKVQAEALALCERLWKRFPGDKTWGLRLAGCLASQRNNAQALEVYSKLLEKDKDPEILALTAVLLARMGRDEDARAHLDKIPKDLEGPSLCYNIACAFALLGEGSRAAQCLQRAFELTIPSRLEATKKQALADEDLAFLRDTDELQVALAAQSKVLEPSCESGSACDTCPSRSSSGGCDSKK